MSKENVRWFLKYLRPHVAKLVLGIGCMVIVSASIGSQILIIRWIFDELAAPIPGRFRRLLPVMVVLAYTLQAAAEVGRTYLVRQVGQAMIHEIRSEIYEHYLRQSPALFVNRSGGDLQARIMHDVESVQRMMTVLLTLVQKPVTLIVLVAAAISQQPQLFIVVVATVLIVILPLKRLRHSVRQSSRNYFHVTGQLFGIVQESILGAAIIRAFQDESRQLRKFRELSFASFRESMRATLASSLAGPLTQTLASVGAAITLAVGFNAVAAGTMTAGALVAFIVALGLLYDPLKSLAQIPTLAQQANAGMDRLREIGKMTEAVRDRPDAKMYSFSTVSVSFHEVTFTYRTATILRRMNLEIPPGQHTVIQGLSGGGKTTLLNLLLRFYDVDEGSIRINNVDIRDFTLASLRSHMSLVTQDTFLFAGTIAENLRVGKPTATDQEIEHAAVRAGADGFIQRLPQKYDTPIGDLGAGFSGGERQRLAIARAFLNDAPLLLLDEPTSALDANTEADLLQELLKVRRGRTTIVVTHRSSGLDYADRVLELEQGELRERERRFPSGVAL